MNFRCGKIIFLSVGILLAIATLIVVVFAYIVPLIQYSEYSLESCNVLAVQITQPDDFHGIVTLDFASLTSSVDVIQNSVRAVVQAYLDANFRVGSSVRCYVSTGDIRVSIWTSNVGLVFTIVLCIATIICVGIFIVLHIIDRNRRKNYRDLDADVKI